MNGGSLSGRSTAITGSTSIPASGRISSRRWHLAGNAPLTGTLGLSLRGSSRSIAALLRCQAGHYQPAYRALVVVDVDAYVLPLPSALPY
jgi:hypothetical protein